MPCELRFERFPIIFGDFGEIVPKRPKMTSKIDILNVSSRDGTVLWKGPPGLKLRQEVEKDILKMLSTQLS